MKIVIIGAGIAGSTLALALSKFGIECRLLEQATELSEVGAGIQISPNGVQILENLGLREALSSFSTEPDFHKYTVWDTGEIVLKTPLKPLVREAYGHAYYHAHRADLIAALTNELAKTSLLKLGCKVISVEQGADATHVICDDGEVIEADMVVGADGIHSMVREQLFRPDPPRESGYVAWRGVLDAEEITDLEIPVSAYVDMGPRLSFVYYYVSAGKKFNWLALGQTDDPKRESWSQTASKEEVIAAFDGWYDRPRTIIEATPEIFVTSLHDREPLETWVNGRVVLIGDAAHAMLPYHAQGAVQSLEDAWVLARLVEQSDTGIESTLKQFESLRYNRANLLVQQSRAAEGWYHVDTPAEIEARNVRFRKTNAKLKGGFSPQQHWLYSYDAEKAALGTDNQWRSLAPWG